MPRNHTRRRFLVAGSTTAVAVATSGVVTGQEDVYTDEAELVPPADILGPEWNEFEENEDIDNEAENSRSFQSGNRFVRIGVLLIDEDENLEAAFEDLVERDEDLEVTLEDLADEFLTTGESIDIGDEAIYNEVNVFGIVVVRDRNAVGVVSATRIIDSSSVPDRTTAIDAAEALVDHWQEETP